MNNIAKHSTSGKASNACSVRQRLSIGKANVQAGRHSLTRAAPVPAAATAEDTSAGSGKHGIAAKTAAVPLMMVLTALGLQAAAPVQAAQTQLQQQHDEQHLLKQPLQNMQQSDLLRAPDLLETQHDSTAAGSALLQQHFAAAQTTSGVSGTASSSSSSSDPGSLPAIYRRLPPLPTSFPDLPKLQQPAIVSEVLPNGLQVYLLEDREVPLTRGSLLMPGGQVSSPANQVGLASIAASVLRSGGSKAHPAALMDERLEDLAAAIEASAGQQSITFDFQCFTQDTREVLGLLAELLQQPALPADKLSLVQAQVSNVIRHRDDNSASVARRELYKLLYGEDSIYARTPTLSGVASITPADLASHIATWQRPDGAILGLVGDFNTQDMMSTVKEVLGNWSPAAGQPATPPQRPHAEPRDLPGVTAAAGAAAQDQQQPELVYLTDRPGAGQASVYAGEPGISLSDPDTYALDVLASSLNSFGGVLFDELRTKEGLAYSVAASWDTPADHRGLFVAAAETVQPAKLIQGLSRVLSSTRVAAPSQQELAVAKSGLLNSFVFNFASTYSQLQRTLVYQLLGLPQDFLFRYRDRVDAVTPSDIRAAAERHLHPSQQVVVVVGDASVVQPQLEQAGFRVQPLQPIPP